MATSKKTARKRRDPTGAAPSKSGKAPQAPAVDKRKATAVAAKPVAASKSVTKQATRKSATKSATSAAPRVARQPTSVVSAPAAKKAAAAKKLPIAERPCAALQRRWVLTSSSSASKAHSSAAPA